MSKKILTVIFLTAVLLSCKKDPDENLPTEPVIIELNGPQTSLVAAGNSFAFDIFNKTAGSVIGDENVIISPLSISYALSMTLNGANNATRDSIMNVLRLSGISVDDINASCKGLTEALVNVDKRVLMTIANSVWTENDFIVKPAFINALSDYYDAESKSFDITDKTVPSKINSWIEQKTNGLIKNMIDNLNDNAAMLLINAIYFKGKWQVQFDKAKTVNENFTLNGGTKNQVPMMKIEDSFGYYAGNGFSVAEFPYGQGNFVMDVILPDPQTSLTSFLPQVKEPAFSGWISNLRSRELNVSFPRFKYGYKRKLKDVLSEMGMKIAFHDGADFTNIADNSSLVINEVTHQAFIETNEEGTEAAAATVVEIGFTSIGPTAVEFRMDHPFIYVIRETTTNSILFMGSVADPLK